MKTNSAITKNKMFDATGIDTVDVKRVVRGGCRPITAYNKKDEFYKTLNDDQKKFFDLAMDMDAGNLLLTGSGGVGKTYLMNGIIKILRNCYGKQVVVTSSTASSASLLGGCTFHKFFGFPASVCATPTGRFKISARESLVKCDVLIVDEISMIRCDVWESAFRSIVYANDKRKKQGKKNIRIICVGDFAQLPPVIQETEKVILDNMFGFDVKGGYAFMAPGWKMCNFKPYILKEVVRQNNKEFVEKLNRVRHGEPIDALWLLDNSACEEIKGAPYLMPYNRQVDAYNLKRLNELDGKLYEFKPELVNAASDTIIEALGLERTLYLKEGCEVRFVANAFRTAPWILESGLPENLKADDRFDWTQCFKNGSTGIVRHILWDEKLRDGQGDWEVLVEVTDKSTYSGGDHYVIVTRRDFETYDYKVDSRGNLKRYVTGVVRQLPIMPNYAISIHRSQGQTLEAANIDLRGSFCHGMAYVALSRVSNINNCYIFDTQMKEKDVICDPDVVEFYKEIEKEIETV